MVFRLAAFCPAIIERLYVIVPLKNLRRREAAGSGSTLGYKHSEGDPDIYTWTYSPPGQFPLPFYMA